jgi:hypothetical protein
MKGGQFGFTLGNLGHKPEQMTLDEKLCWNPTWIVMDNVGWARGVFFQAYFKKVSLPNENSEALWVLK